MTVGTPIKNGDDIRGVLLLHSPVEGMNQANAQGIKILAISIFTALILSFFLSFALAFAFTKPLKIMRNTANALTLGNYTAKTNINTSDEIGDLAKAIDILSESLEKAKRNAGKLDKLRRDFVANVSHELKTPVTVLRGSLEALDDDIVTDSEQVKEYYKQMLKESMFLERLVNDLLDLSRLQNTDFQIEMQDLSLCEVLNDAKRSAGQLAAKKNIEILLDCQQNKVVLGDYGRLRQMFMIILDNAVKFSPDNATVNIYVENNIVSICDYGVGISKEDLPYIFDRFYKINSEDNKNGSGLGLAIAKQIAERHHINISVNSKLNEGTEFRFSFS